MSPESGLAEKVANHAERITAVETTQEDHGRRLSNHGMKIDRISITGWLILGGVATNILITVWKR